MIVFVNDLTFKNIINNNRNVLDIDSKIISSIIEFNLPKLKKIIPFNTKILNRFQELAFDEAYFKYLNSEGFDDILKIVIPEYYAGDKLHFYITNHNDFYDSVIESLEKFLKIKFGIEVEYINTMEDFYQLEMKPTSISPIGLSEITDTIEVIMSRYDTPMKQFINSYVN